MTTAEKIAVMQAYVDGKQIQTETLGGAWIDWVSSDTPSWNWGDYDYRIKPEPKEPTYRPYNDFAEFRKDWEKHGGWAKFSKNNVIIHFSNYTDELTLDLLEDYTWADDGSPCGVLVEEGGEV